MRIGHSKCIMIFECIFIMIVVTHSNPLELVPFTEIQVVDQTHWTIEFDFMNWERHYPAYTDTVTLYCGSNFTADSMKKCTNMIGVDNSGIALITEKHFPSIRMKPGSTLYMGIKGNRNYYKSVTIPNSLSPQTSIVGAYSEQKCCNSVGDYCLDYCSREYEFKECKCPSLGVRNEDAYITIVGGVNDSSNNPVDSIQVSIENGGVTQYTSGGKFNFRSSNYCKKQTFTFSDKNGNMISDTTIGPFDAGKQIQLNVKIDLPTNSTPKKSIQKPSSTKLLAASATKGIVIAISETSVALGEVQVYSMNGMLVRKLYFNCHGSGTYTINWNRRNERNQIVPSGKYNVRVLIGKESLCTGILSW